MLIHVNGVDLFYEKSGTGKPIVLIHGNGESHKIFDELVELLNKQFTVFAIDSRGHGKSSEVSELDYCDMAEDIACFIQELNLEQPVLYGFSDGGIIGLLVASKFPTLLQRLVVSGANLNPQGLTLKFRILFRLKYLFNHSKEMRLMMEQPNISLEELEKITIPTLVLAGEKDLISEKHTKLIAHSIQNSSYEILKKENHGSYVIHSTKLLPFLEML